MTGVKVLRYLLHCCVADGVRVVVVVDDLEVSDRVTFRCSGEVNLRFGFASSLCVNGEVGGFTHLHPCTVQTKTLSRHAKSCSSSAGQQRSCSDSNVKAVQQPDTETSLVCG